MVIPKAFTIAVTGELEDLHKEVLHNLLSKQPVKLYFGLNFIDVGVVEEEEKDYDIHRMLWMVLTALSMMKIVVLNVSFNQDAEDPDGVLPETEGAEAGDTQAGE